MFYFFFFCFRSFLRRSYSLSSELDESELEARLLLFFDFLSRFFDFFLFRSRSPLTERERERERDRPRRTGERDRRRLRLPVLPVLAVLAVVVVVVVAGGSAPAVAPPFAASDVCELPFVSITIAYHTSYHHITSSYHHRASYPHHRVCQIRRSCFSRHKT